MATHTRSVPLVLLLLALGSGLVQAQNRTTVTVAFDGSQTLRTEVEEGLSHLLTELNRAHYFHEHPDLTDQRLTPEGRSAVMEHWTEERLRSPETRLKRPLVRGQRRGTYEIRSVPLLAENQSGSAKTRTGIFVVNSDGQVIDFLYRSERATSPRPGSIVIRTKPSGARVVTAIDDGTRTSPARFTSVPPDTYAFTIRADGFRTVRDTTFTVRPGREVEHTVDLRAATGVLQVADVAPGATVQVDGDTIRAETALDVSANPHEILVSAEGYARWDTTVAVPPGDSMTVRPELQRRQVPLTVQSTPSGATVFLNDDSLGTTPLDTTVAADSAYTIRVTKAGHIPSPPAQVQSTPDSALTHTTALTPIETTARAERAQLANVQARRARGVVDLRYDLIGVSGETYRVDVSVLRADGSRQSVRADSLQGDVGPKLAPGPDKMIRWRSPLPAEGTIQLALTKPGRRHRTLYIVGGAAALAGTAAAILLSGGRDGGDRSFPAPPGLPE